jgi:DNA polymerase-3 subunit delta'
VDGLLTRGQAPAVAAVRSMIAGGAPHAVLLTGPGSVGKTTLALDLAAGLLCEARLPAERPCRACRACRRVASGNHPDLHRLAPGGSGNQIKIGATTTDPRPGVRELVDDLSLMSMEGGARVAVIEGAHRMNEDAQNALLKTLEEPPPGVVIVLCADDEERLLPTIRSRCQRIRLGTLRGREIEAWLTDRGLADAPTAARAARLADGRPGLALAYVRAPDALAARAELDRTLLDLLAARPSARLAAMSGLLARARDLATSLAAGNEPSADIAASARGVPGPRGRRPAARGAGGAAGATGASMPVIVGAAGPPTEARDEALAADGETADASPDEAGRPVRLATTERRRGALTLVEVWRRLALDVARAERGEPGGQHDPGLLEEVAAAAGRVPAGATARFLVRLDEVGRAIDGNASPELAMDVLALAWPAA